MVWSDLKQLSWQWDFMNPPIIFILLLQRVLQIIINNIHANDIQDVIFMFFVNPMVKGCCIGKMLFLTQWFYYGSSC